MLFPELTLAAFAAAGLAASPHCALMCGCLQATQLRPGNGRSLRRGLLLMHAGRIAGYALLGALVSAGGLLLFRHLPEAALGLPLQGLAALILLLMGLRQLRDPRPSCGSTHRPALPVPGPGRVFLRGLAWALLPCGALYGMLFIALLSLSPIYAALMMAAFGLGTLPLLGAGGLLLRRAAGQGKLRRPAAVLLITFGAAGLAMAGMGAVAPGPSFCLTAR